MSLEQSVKENFGTAIEVANQVIRLAFVQDVRLFYESVFRDVASRLHLI
jgi:hypothetical protein